MEGLGVALTPASFAGRSVDCMTVTGHLATCGHALVEADRIHENAAVHNRHCLQAQHGTVQRTGFACSLFRFCPQEVLLCCLLWTMHTRNRPPHKVTNNACGKKKWLDKAF